eukprot:TRINITY_DN6422_c7_g1_i1.p1 TRINITY_DN6422_c7_g1~~TRINITY_DN6422_c7_g1_i1.p1  ORF type:complete len:342 (+),score=35.32 TRINITY_DN6422_c7_g1_i1:55-1080(+)
MLRRVCILRGYSPTTPVVRWGFQSLGEQQNVSTATYQANRNNEDRLVTADTLDGDVWVGVCDGHGGPQVSEFVSKTIVKAVRLELQGATDSSFEEVERAMQQAFVNVDNAFIESVRPAHQLGFNEVRRVGSCALLTRLRGNKLFIANAGDCRALVGNPSGNTGGFEITTDHTAMDETFQQQLKQEHPNEDNVIVKKSSGACYIKGRLMPARALGDLDLKYMEFAGPREASLAGTFYSIPFTPPYISCVPDVTCHTLKKETFVVVASDGLWDELSSPEVFSFINKYQGSQEHCAKDLLELALERVAESCQEPLAEIKRKPVGIERRQRHDDITVAVVMYRPN